MKNASTNKNAAGTTEQMHYFVLSTSLGEIARRLDLTSVDKEAMLRNATPLHKKLLDLARR